MGVALPRPDLEEGRRLAPELVALRRDLHRHPELSFRETRTASVVAERLEALGLPPRREVGITGVVAAATRAAVSWSPAGFAAWPATRRISSCETGSRGES